ncbi:hypothetical protein BKD26_15980 [Streptomyces sp. CB03238]|nr:hypothetical protein BKD26_15980 [Streptomyces sp. CB03238]
MGELIERRRRAGFVGREREKALFRGNFDTEPDDERHRFVFHVVGNAGVGKTTLVRELQETADRLGAVTAYVDEDVNSVPEAMAAISARFARRGHALKALDRQLTTYRQRCHEAELSLVADQPDASPSPGSMALAQAGLIGASMLPVVGALTGAVDPARVARRADELRAALSARFHSPEDVQLVLDPLKVLTPVLVAELDRVAAEAPWLALFFDTYERTAPFLDIWLRDLITGARYGALPGNAVLTLAGQRRLDPACWADVAELIEELPLQPFTEPETRRLLSAKGIVDEPVVQDVLRLSGGLPVLVTTLAAKPGEPSTAGATAVDRFLKWENDPARRAAALACALPRRLNEDVFIAATGEPAGLFGWLRTLPFVSEGDGHAKYHDVVRDPMLRLQRTDSPRRWREAHQGLAETFAGWRASAATGLDPEGLWRDPHWRELREEELYHLLCADPRGALPTALAGGADACKEGPAVARRWARTLAAAGHDTDAELLRQWATDCLDALGDEERGVVRVLGLLLARGGLDVEGQVRALDARSFHHRVAERYDESHADCARMIDLAPGDWRGWFDRGLTHRLLGAWDEALADFARAAELRPDTPRIIRELGEAHYGAGRPSDALRELDRALALDPSDAAALASRAAAHEALGRPREALADVDLALDIRPDYRWALHRRAHVLRGLGDTEGALRDLTRAEALKPDDPWTLGERGETYRYAGRYEEAIAAYDRAIALDPGYAWAFGSRAMAHDALGRTEEALADLARAVELKPDYVWALVRRAEILARLGDTAGRFAALDRAVGVAPGDSWARWMRADALEEAGRHEEALADLDRAVEAGGERAENWRMRGFVLYRARRYEEAAADLDRALELAPDNAAALSTRASIHERHGRVEEALADLNRAVELDGGDVWALIVRSSLRERTGDVEGGLADRVRAAELAPDDARVLTLAGEGHRRAGRHEQAIAFFDRAIGLAPDSYWAVGSRGQALRALGRHEAALADLDRAEALAPDKAWIVAERGAVHQDRRRYHDARRELDRAVAMDPSAGYVHERRALFHRATGRLPDALADLDRCLELGHETAWAHRALATVQLLLGRPDEALAALADVPDHALGSEAHRRAGRLDIARGEAELLSAEDPGAGAPLLAMAVSRIEGLSAAAGHWRAAGLTHPLIAACSLGEWSHADDLLAGFLTAAPPWDELARTAHTLAELLQCPGADPDELEPRLRRVEAARDAFDADR